jgi:Flp pilus assembly protein CpaB
VSGVNPCGEAPHLSPRPTYGRRVPTREQLKQDLTRRRRAVRRVVLARRRPLAALLAAAAVIAGVHELRTPPPDVEAVLTAARDLPAGVTLGRDDLVTVDYAAGTAPAGLADDAVGRILAAPVRAGEPLTDVRLVGASLAAAYPDSVAVPVRLPDAGMAALLRVGDRIDLVAADPQGSVARVVATDLAVVALPAPDEEATSSGLPGRLVLLAAPEAAREDLAQAAVTGFLTFTYSR